jgi:hypothetical protein
VALRHLRIRSLRAFLRQELSREEEPATARLMARLAGVRRRGAFSRAEFLAMCRWKSPRALPRCRRNSAAAIRRFSGAVLRTRSERRRMALLTRLHGVGVPTASAILTLVDPRRYGVLDIRVWQLLFAVRSVTRRPGGRGFTVRDWLDFLAELRGHARALRAPVRAVEYTLFRCHRRLQRGRLYDR